MKQKTMIRLALLFVLVFQAGCGADDTVYLEQTEPGTEYATVATEGNLRDDRAATEEVVRDDRTDTEEAVRDDRTDTGACYVYVCGAVCVPGVYALEQGSRIYEALALAGGLTGEASVSAVNQAETVRDGQMIYIPTEEEVQKGIVLSAETASGGSWTDSSALGSGADSSMDSDSRLNLNTATASELMTLPGIGQTKADSILAYREKHGEFSSVEEIMNVDGIKEGVYNRIKDSIKVN